MELKLYMAPCKSVTRELVYKVFTFLRRVYCSRNHYTTVSIARKDIVFLVESKTRLIEKRLWLNKGGFLKVLVELFFMLVFKIVNQILLPHKSNKNTARDQAKNRSTLSLITQNASEKIFTFHNFIMGLPE